MSEKLELHSSFENIVLIIEANLTKLHDVNIAIERIGNKKYPETILIGEQLKELRTQIVNTIHGLINDLLSIRDIFQSQLEDEIFYNDKKYKGFILNNLPRKSFLIYLYDAILNYNNKRNKYVELDLGYNQFGVDDVGRFAIFRMKRAIKLYKKAALTEMSKIITLIDYLNNWIKEILGEVNQYKGESENKEVKIESKEEHIESGSNVFYTPALEVNADPLNKTPLEISKEIDVDPENPMLNKLDIISREDIVKDDPEGN